MEAFKLLKYLYSLIVLGFTTLLVLTIIHMVALNNVGVVDLLK